MQAKNLSKKIKHNTKPPKSQKEHSKSKRENYWPWILLVAIIVFAVIIRLRLLQIPLERDEGEFAYMGQLMLQGIPPYLLAYNMKLPGIYAIYALIMAIFGQTIPGIHVGLMLVNCIAIILLFLLTRLLFGNGAALIAAAGYALLSLSPSVLGTSAHATQFVVPFALSGTILLLKSVDSDKYLPLFFSGLLYGLAFIIKQHALFFIAFALFYFTAQTAITRPINWKRLAAGNAILAISSALPFIITCIFLYNAGVFSRFWFWTFTYAREYVSQKPMAEVFTTFRSNIIKVIDSWGLLWAIAGVGLSSIFWNDKSRSNKFFLLGFFFFSFLTVCPGFYFRNHYFITLLPAIAMLAGVATTASIEWLSNNKIAPIVRIIPVFIIVASFIYPTGKLGNFFFQITPIEACRMMYGLNPFPESIEIAEYIKKHSANNERVAVIGSEPQIYFYANRKSATGYIYTYSLMETNSYASQMQLEMIKEIQKADPGYAVFVNIPDSWLDRPNSDMTIINWSKKHFNQNYTTVGLIDSISETDYKIYWDKEAEKNRPVSPFNIFVMERDIK